MPEKEKDPSFLKPNVKAYHLETEDSPAFKAHTSISVLRRLLVIQFLLPSVELMTSLISKLQMILEQGHNVHKEMLAGHVPVEMGVLKDSLAGNNHPFLILQNISSRTMKEAVVKVLNVLKIETV